MMSQRVGVMRGAPSAHAAGHGRSACYRAGRGFFAARGIEVAPSRANFVLARVGDAAGVRARLLRRGFAVRECTSFGLPEWVRIATPGTRDLPRLLAAIEASLEDQA